MGHKTVHYLALLARVPDDFGNVGDIELVDNQVSIHGSLKKTPVLVKASRHRQDIGLVQHHISPLTSELKDMKIS